MEQVNVVYVNYSVIQGKMMAIVLKINVYGEIQKKEKNYMMIYLLLEN